MAKQQNSPLPSGTQLQQYKIDRVISTGGFSIVYLAYNEHGLPVAIKEFIPSGMLIRSSGEKIQVQNPDEQRRFQMGLRTFFREAEVISRIDSRSVVRILNFFLANNTAYLVMPFEHGRTLQHLIVHQFESLTDAVIQRIFCDILAGLCIFHANDILHLDLKPSNVWIRTDESAMIIDFGTSRIGKDAKSSAPPMFTPGFAAPEQHRKQHHPEKIGPWTDIYNLGATIYSCIEGEPPATAEERVSGRDLPLLEERWAGQYTGKLLRMVDKMIRLDISQRPQEAEKILASMSRYAPMPTRDVFSRYAKSTFYSS